MIVKPTTALTASTKYEVLGPRKPSCTIVECWQEPDAGPEGYVLTTFTTGTGPDVTPPSFAGATGVEVSPLEVCGGDCTCAPSTTVHFQLQWSDATADTGIATYHLYAGSPSEPPVVAAGGTHGVLTCTGYYESGGPGRLLRRREHVLRASRGPRGSRRAHLRFGHALVARGDGVLGGDVDRDLGDLVEAVGRLHAGRKRGHGKQRQGDARNA